MAVLEEVKSLYRETAERVRNDTSLLLDAMRTAGNNPSQNFGNQLLIYSQRPEATELDTFDGWKERGAYVKRGTHSVRLIAPGANQTQYLFDVTDTSRGTPAENRFKMDEAARDRMALSLSEEQHVFDEAVTPSDNLYLALQDIGEEVDSISDIRLSAEANEASVEMAKAMVLFRLGAEKEEVERLTNLSNVSALSAVDFNRAGARASKISQEALSTINEIITKERLQNEERSIQRADVSRGDTARRDSGMESGSESVPEDELGTSPRLRSESVSVQATGLSESNETGRSGDYVSDGRAGRGSIPDGHQGTGDVRPDSAGLPSNERSDGRTEGEKPDSVDGSLQSVTETGRGSSGERDRLRLNDPAENRLITLAESLGVNREALKSLADEGMASVATHFFDVQQLVSSVKVDRAYSAYQSIGLDIPKEKVIETASKDIIVYIQSRGETSPFPDPSPEELSIKDVSSIEAPVEETVETPSMRVPKAGDIIRFTPESNENDGKLYMVEDFDGYTLSVNMIDPSEEDEPFAHKVRYGDATTTWQHYLEYVDDYKLDIKADLDAEKIPEYITVDVYFDTIVSDYSEDNPRYVGTDNSYEIEVERSFLEEWVKGTEERDLDTFFREYTLDDTIALYTDAKAAGALNEDYEDIIKNDFPDFKEGDVVRRLERDSDAIYENRYFISKFTATPVPTLELRPLTDTEKAPLVIKGSDSIRSEIINLKYELHGGMVLDDGGVISLDNGDKIFVQATEEDFVDYTIYRPDENGEYKELDGGIYEWQFGETTAEELIRFAYHNADSESPVEALDDPSPAFVSFEATNEDPYEEKIEPATPVRERTDEEIEKFCAAFNITNDYRKEDIKAYVKAKEKGENYTLKHNYDYFHYTRTANEYGYENLPEALNDFASGNDIEAHKARYEAKKGAWSKAFETLGLEWDTDWSIISLDHVSDTLLINNALSDFYPKLYERTGRHLNYLEAKEFIKGLWKGIDKDASFDYESYFDSFKGEDKVYEAVELPERQIAPDGGDVIPVGTVVYRDGYHYNSYDNIPSYPCRVEYVDYDNGFAVLRNLARKEVEKDDKGQLHEENSKPILTTVNLDTLRKVLHFKEADEEHKNKRFDKQLTELAAILGEDKDSLKTFINKSYSMNEPYGARLTKRVDAIKDRNAQKTQDFFPIPEGKNSYAVKGAITDLIKRFISSHGVDLTAYKAYDLPERDIPYDRQVNTTPDLKDNDILFGQEVKVDHDTLKIAYERYPSNVDICVIDGIVGDTAVLYVKSSSTRRGEKVYVSVDDIYAYTAFQRDMQGRSSKYKTLTASETIEDDIFSHLSKTRQEIEDIIDPTAKEKREAARKAREEKAHYQAYIPSADEAVRVPAARELALDNVEALKVLRAIEADGHKPTLEEKDTLSKYHGWGGCAVVFDEREGKRPMWAQGVNEELKTLLSEEEYAKARSTVNDAFYTDPFVVREIYATLQRMGFEGGRILEPSCGVGAFFSAMPTSMADSSTMYGIEIDPLTARIAKTLYPENTIGNAGFEETTYNDDSFDLVIGNVPFGDITVKDGVHDKERLLIHDFFFQKALDKVRPGGVVAFVTSSGTLDKKNDRVRRALAERAEFMGAVRLPNTAFGGAGTSVTSDVIFLRKREEPIDLSMSVAPDWVQIGSDTNGISMNRYFAQHPENIAGVMQKTKGIHGSEQSTCVPPAGKTWRQAVQDAMRNVEGVYIPAGKTIHDVEDEKEEELESFAYNTFGQKKDGTFVYREGNTLHKAEDVSAEYAKEKAKDPTKADARLAAFIDLRNKAYDTINIQMGGASEEEIAEKQKALSDAYDSFVDNYGRVNDKINKGYFKEDITFAVVSGLEILDGKGAFVRKADIFTKRTIEEHKVVDHVETSQEALLLSIQERGRIDWGYMESLSGKEMPELIADLNGQEIFYDPEEAQYVTRDEYLSGNVRHKLEVAQAEKEEDPEFEKNVLALMEVQPAPIEAADISVNPGAPWIDTAYIEQFVKDVFDVKKVTVEHSSVNNAWRVPGQAATASAKSFGTEDVDAYQILEDVLNMRSTLVYDTKGTGKDKKRVLNEEKTLAANAKQEALKEAFQNWIWADPERRRELTEKYNDMYNCYVPRKYDGSKLVFPGMSSDVSLNAWQRDGVARILYGGNSLLAHVVGAGKTYTMIAAAIEEKRLGLSKKPLFVVPNHLTEQWGAEFRKLYPAANVLVATQKDFSKDNRRKTFAKIATGNYDAVVIGHSQIGKIPLDKKRQLDFIQSEIDMYATAIEREKMSEDSGKSISVKELEKMKKKLEKNYEDLDKSATDEGLLTFERLGVDRLYIDEAHEFKNLYTPTKHTRVSGIQTTQAQKSLDLLAKIRYIDSVTGNKGTVFATGTPISNSMTELYTNMRYLQNKLLTDTGLADFDSWISVFGNIKDELTLNPEGGSFKMRTICSSFNNLPELISMFSEAADVKTADSIEIKGVPDVDYVNVEVERSDEQADIISELGDRAEQLRAGNPATVPNKDGKPIKDNMLNITGTGRKAALDQRLVDNTLPDDPASKLNKCVDTVFEVWKNSSDYKGAQLIFCDQGTPKGKASKEKPEEGETDNTDKDADILSDLNAGNFCVYDEVKDKLVKLGIPKEQIAFIHDYPDPADKKKLYDKVNAGEIRVLLGSTMKMGAGMNVQEKLVALHHLDVPWRPSDIEQREGRIIRQGNKLIKDGIIDKVKVFKYITKDTFDSYSWEIIGRKLKSIGQVMTSKEPQRVMEDVSAAALQANEAIALSIGDPRIKEFMELKATIIPSLKAQKNSWIREHHEIEDKVSLILPAVIKDVKKAIEERKADIERIEENSKTFSITVCGKEKDRSFTEAPVKQVTKDGKEKVVSGKEAGFTSLYYAALRAGTSTAREKIGEYRGLEIQANSSGVFLKGDGCYYLRTGLGKSPETIEKHLNAAIDEIKAAVPRLEGQLKQTEKDLEYYKSRVGETFPKEEELQKSLERYQELEKVYSELKVKKEEKKALRKRGMAR